MHALSEPGCSRQSRSLAGIAFGLLQGMRGSGMEEPQTFWGKICFLSEPQEWTEITKAILSFNAFKKWSQKHKTDLSALRARSDACLAGDTGLFPGFWI